MIRGLSQNKSQLSPKAIREENRAESEVCHLLALEELANFLQLLGCHLSHLKKKKKKKNLTSDVSLTELLGGNGRY